MEQTQIMAEGPGIGGTELTGTEDTQDTGAGSQPEQAETAQAAFDPNTLITLGDGQEITLGELQRGYLRQADYTRKTQELADQRRQIEQQQQFHPQERAETTPADPFNFPEIKRDELTTESEHMLADAIEAQRTIFLEALREIATEFHGLKPLRDEYQTTSAARKEAEHASSVFGRTVTPAEIKAAKDATGEDNPIAALYTHQNAKNARGQMGNKPKTPSGDGRGYSALEDPNASILDMIREIESQK